MTVIGWSNDDHDFTLLNGFVDTTPGSRGFDSTIVKTAIGCNATGESHRADLLADAWGGAARSQLRWQFATTHSGSFAPFTSSGNLVVFKSVLGGVDLFRIAHTSTPYNIQLQYWSGSAWVGVGAVVAMPVGYTVHTITIDIADVGGTLTWHMNGLLMAGIIAGDTKFTSVTTIDQIGMWNLGAGAGFESRFTFAEHILADSTFMTYGLRVTNPAITGAGTNSGQASGVYTDVNELATNTATAMTFATVGQTFTGAMADLDAALSTSPIVGVRISALARRGGSGPQTVKMALQETAGLQVGTARALSGVGYVPVAQAFLINPATSAPFTYAEVNAMEPGVQAAT